MPSLLAILHTLGLPVSKWPERADPVTQAVLIGLGIVVLVVIRFPKVAYVITKLIVPPPPLPPERPRVFRGLLQYDEKDAEQFYGRTADGDACWDRIRRKPFFILEGESGCGKSSLLNVDLLPRAREAFRVVACRCGEDPFGKLRSALLGERYERGRRYGKPALNQAIETVGQEPGDGPPRPLLVCIDQFEELFVTVKDQVRRQFVEALKEAIEEDKLRLVVAIRKDFADLLLDACRDVDPDHVAFAFDRESYYTLRSFAADQAEGVVKQMLDRDEIHGGDPLRRRELEEFAGALVQELLRPPLDKRLSPEDELRVLPVELQMVGYTYESILGRRFTAAELRRRGGKAGLYRDYIDDAKDYVFRKTGVSGETALLVLRRLISPAGTKWAPSVGEIAASQAGLTARQVADVLQAFAECYLVHRVRSESASERTNGVESRRFELMHEHLVQLLAEAPEPELQRVRDAEARLDFWRDRTRHMDATVGEKTARPAGPRLRALGARFVSLYTQPIPIGETFRLWRYARDREDRRMLGRNLRGFLAQSSSVLMLFSVPWIGWMFFERKTLLPGGICDQ